MVTYKLGSDAITVMPVNPNYLISLIYLFKYRGCAKVSSARGTTSFLIQTRP